RNTIKILLRTFCLLGFIIGISSCKESVGTVYVEKNYVSPVSFSSEELEFGDVKVYLSTNTKDAFKGCKSLRTVVVKCGKAMVFENPFESCPDYLTFVYPENSEIERFAFEHGYRVINV
ncbi:MAG: hypothetical protein HUK25_01885, partial [Treponema sp.]|nr:hypothetical protein [Treponema sp.]